MTLDLDAIEARAKAATDVDNTWFGAFSAAKALACTEADAAHIAGMDPQTVLAMVAEIRRLRGTP